MLSRLEVSNKLGWHGDHPEFQRLARLRATWAVVRTEPRGEKKQACAWPVIRSDGPLTPLQPVRTLGAHQPTALTVREAAQHAVQQRNKLPRENTDRASSRVNWIFPSSPLLQLDGHIGCFT